MPQISVITPTNSLRWFRQARASILRQTMPDWEWVVCLNGKILEEIMIGNPTQLAEGDPRIKVVVYDGAPNPDGSFNVGALKKMACQHVSTPYAVEFDHDDELALTCLEELLAAFESTDAVFVYSNSARVNEDGSTNKFDPAYGWEYESQLFTGARSEALLVAKHPLFLPQNVAKILFAPDHVRAWRMKSYHAIGGHSASMKICDDLDLMCRLYTHSGGKFHHVDRLLYRYNVHGNNTWLQNVQLIDQKMWENYDSRIQEMAMVHWTGAGRRLIDLGGGINSPIGWEAADKFNAPILADLDGPWPFEDGSVGAFRAHDVIEHLRDPIHVMNEAYRCLVHGGLFLIEVPSTDGRGAFQDPSHISFWNSNSFFYYTKAQQHRYILHLGVKCRFQAVRMANYFPSEWHKFHNILYTKAHLAAIKDGPRLHGLYEI